VFLREVWFDGDAVVNLKCEADYRVVYNENVVERLAKHL
jgi:hypothetical protein